MIYSILIRNREGVSYFIILQKLTCTIGKSTGIQTKQTENARINHFHFKGENTQICYDNDSVQLSSNCVNFVMDKMHEAPSIYTWD